MATRRGQEMVKQQSEQPKRLKVIVRGDTWVDAQILCDGKPLDALSLKYEVTVDSMNMVVVTFDASDVQMDIQTPSHAEYWVPKDQTA